MMLLLRWAGVVLDIISASKKQILNLHRAVHPLVATATNQPDYGLGFLHLMDIVGQLHPWRSPV